MYFELLRHSTGDFEIDWLKWFDHVKGMKDYEIFL
jgi:hypothetical protein